MRAFARRLAEPGNPPASFDSSDGLSIIEGDLVALVYNPDLRMARLRAGVAEATAEHGGRWEDPNLGVDVLKITESVANPWVLISNLSLTIPVSGRLEAEQARADAELRAELARVVEQEWEVRRKLRDEWAGWSADRLRLDLTKRLVGSLDAILETTGRLAEAGELPETESSLFAIEQEDRRAELRRLEGEVARGEHRLKALMGLSPEASVRLTPAVAFAASSSGGADLKQSNPTLVRLREEYAAAETTLLREIREQFPDVSLGLQLEEDGGQTRAGGTGGVPLPILNANKGGIAEARAERELARAAFETEFERLTGRLAAERAGLEAVRARRRSIDSKLVPLIDRQLVDAKRLVELGEGDSLVLLESLVRAHEAKLDLIESELEESRRETAIRFLSGPGHRDS